MGQVYVQNIQKHRLQIVGGVFMRGGSYGREEREATK